MEDATWVDVAISPEVLLGAFGPGGDSTEDLTVAKVEEFNRAHRLPPSSFQDSDGKVIRTVYRSISADADLGGKALLGLRYVDTNDVYGMPPLVGATGTVLYRVMGEYLSAELRGFILRTLVARSAPSFQLNDMIVSVNSARYTLPNLGQFPFVEIQQREGNHTTVGKGDVGLLVLQNLRNIQPIN